jgi:hypothetical protein
MLRILFGKPHHLSGCLFFTFLITLLSCSKERSVETGNGGPAGGTTGGTASFELVASGTNCSDAAVSGTFLAGTALNSGSTLTVTVNVKKTGSWTYSTAKVNGFVFAGAGEFTATGSQAITLLAVGTPAAAGNFLFSLAFGGAGCSVSVNVAGGGGGGNGGAITGDIYYKATIGGVNYTQDVTDNNGYEAGSGMGGVDDVDFSGSINYGNPPAPAGKTEMGMSKGVMHNYLRATKADFYAFFAPGDYPYTSSFSQKDGVMLGWGDPSGGSWSTSAGSGDQTGSTFKIISTEDARDILGRVYIKVKMQFNCKLYNETTGEMKECKNGEMVAVFGML